MLERFAVSGVPCPKVAVSDRVNVFAVELVEVAKLIDENHTLVRFFGEVVVADSVVSKVIEDFECEEVAGCADVDIPIEYRLVDDFDMPCMAPRGRGGCQLGSLPGSEGGGDFDDFELGAFVDVGVAFPDVVEDVQHERSVTRAKLIDDKVVERVMGELVICDEIAGYCFAVVGTEELCWGMPQLPGVVEGFLVQRVFKLGISFP